MLSILQLHAPSHSGLSPILEMRTLRQRESDNLPTVTAVVWAVLGGDGGQTDSRACVPGHHARPRPRPPRAHRFSQTSDPRSSPAVRRPAIPSPQLRSHFLPLVPATALAVTLWPLGEARPTFPAGSPSPSDDTLNCCCSKAQTMPPSPGECLPGG